MGEKNYRAENGWVKAKNKNCCQDKAQQLLQKFYEEEFSIATHPFTHSPDFSMGVSKTIKLIKQQLHTIFDLPKPTQTYYCAYCDREVPPSECFIHHIVGRLHKCFTTSTTTRHSSTYESKKQFIAFQKHVKNLNQMKNNSKKE